jgi:uncharacterized membrane protein (UPF0127 family)
MVSTSRTASAVLLALAACAPSPGADVTGPAAGAERAGITFGQDTILVEVANTEAERARGLMGRSSVPDGSGMLFVFPEAAVQGVWMRDTPLPLDAAFIDEDRRISTIVELEPLRASPTPSRAESP